MKLRIEVNLDHENQNEALLELGIPRTLLPGDDGEIEYGGTVVGRWKAVQPKYDQRPWFRVEWLDGDGEVFEDDIIRKADYHAALSWASGRLTRRDDAHGIFVAEFDPDDEEVEIPLGAA